MANNAGGNGPRAGKGTGRGRNTTVNNASKATPYNPYASVGASAGLGADLAAARYQQLLQLAALKKEKGLLKGQFQQGKAQARADRVTGMAETQNASLDSGTWGSSFDFAGRAGVVSEQAATVAQLKQDRAVGKLGIQQEKLGVNADYAQAVSAAQSAYQQDQYASLLDQFSNNLYGANGVDYKSILKRLLDRKLGNAPRRRVGVGHSGAAPAPVGPRGESGVYLPGGGRKF